MEELTSIDNSDDSTQIILQPCDPPPYLRECEYLTASYLNTPFHWHRQATWIRLSIGTAKHYSAYAIFIGTHWPGHGCQDISCDNDQIFGLASALPHILTPTLHWHVETLWSPLHNPHIYVWFSFYLLRFLPMTFLFLFNYIISHLNAYNLLREPEYVSSHKCHYESWHLHIYTYIFSSLCILLYVMCTCVYVWCTPILLILFCFFISSLISFLGLASTTVLNLRCPTIVSA